MGGGSPYPSIPLLGQYPPNPAMLFLAPITAFLLATTVAGLQSPHRRAASIKQSIPAPHKRHTESTPSKFKYRNPKTEKFLVNGTHFPGIAFRYWRNLFGLSEHATWQFKFVLLVLPFQQPSSRS